MLMDKVRLDVACVALGKTRTKAQDLIKDGKVNVNGKVILKPSALVLESDTIEIDDADTYVSRGAYKLKGCLESLGIDLRDQVCLDIGASTGGFTQVCLEKGAKKVYALDVGHLQLDRLLDQDARVIKMEGRNARYIEDSWFEDPINFLCMDVSFISCKTILEPVFSKLKPEHCAVLIKPQFECGPQYLNTKGVLKSEKTRNKIVEDIKHFVLQTYQDVVVEKSQIQGRHGNQEYMLYAKGRR